MKLTEEQTQNFYKLFTRELLDYDGHVQLFADKILQFINELDTARTEQEKCYWETHDNIIFSSCQHPHSMALGKFEIATYKFCPYCGREIKINVVS